MALAPELIKVIFTDKWVPGLNAFYCFCMSPIAIGISLPLYSSILALGRSTILLVMSGWLILLEWTLGVTFVMMYGFTGAALTQLIIVPLFTYVYKMVLARNGINVKILRNVGAQFIVASLVVVVISFLKKFIIVNLLSVCGLAVMSLSLFMVFIWILDKPSVLELKEYLMKSIIK